MEVHTDFTSGQHTLVFDNGKTIDLSKDESNEFEQWLKKKAAQND